MGIQMGDRSHLGSFFFGQDEICCSVLYYFIMHYCLEESFSPNKQMKIF